MVGTGRLRARCGRSPRTLKSQRGALRGRDAGHRCLHGPVRPFLFPSFSEGLGSCASKLRPPERVCWRPIPCHARPPSRPEASISCRWRLGRAWADRIAIARQAKAACGRMAPTVEQKCRSASNVASATSTKSTVSSSASAMKLPVVFVILQTGALGPTADCKASRSHAQAQGSPADRLTNLDSELTGRGAVPDRSACGPEQASVGLTRSRWRPSGPIAVIIARWPAFSRKAGRASCMPTTRWHFSCR